VTATVTELQRIPTSGARAVCSFSVDGLDLLAVPQLALDVAGAAAGMNVGDSDTELLLLRRDGGPYAPHSVLAAPGGEDAEFFRVGPRAFLAVASIRAGAGPYRYDIESTIFEWSGDRFVPFQALPSFAAKQWRHWQVGERHFLGLAQGIDLPHIEGPNRNSVIFEWDGTRFAPFQEIASRWAYNWHAFAVDGMSFLAHADHLGPSRLYRWDDGRFVPHQDLPVRAGRAFADFVRDGHHHLLVAGLEDPPEVLRWSGERFEPYQSLTGLGARELRVVELDGRLHVIRVDFVIGTPHDPRVCRQSRVYEWRDGGLAQVLTFPTCGATDVEVLATTPGRVEFAVSNGLSPDLRFATDSTVFALVDGDAA
jgi:hypothetical protein